MEESDHAHIILTTSNERKTWKRPFKFLSAWITDDTSFEIFEIRVNNEWIKNKQQIENYFIQEFSELYSTTFPELPHNFGNLIPMSVSEEENKDLIYISAQEAPGPDGYLGIFFRTY